MDNFEEISLDDAGYFPHNDDVNNIFADELSDTEESLAALAGKPSYKHGGRKNRAARVDSFVSGHMSSVIFEDEIRIIMEMSLSEIEAVRCKRHIEIKKKFLSKPNLRMLTDVTNDPIAVLESWASNYKQKKRNYREELSNLLNSTDGLYYQLLNFLEPSTKGGVLDEDELIKEIRDIQDKVRGFEDDLLEWYIKMKIAERIKDSICYKKVRLGNFISFDNLEIERDIAILNLPIYGNVVFSANLLLSALDFLQTRFPLILYWKCCDLFEKYPNLSVYKEGMKLISEFEYLRSKLGLKTPDFMKSWEPLVVGYTISLDGDLGCDGLFESQIEEMTEMLKNVGIEDYDFSKLLPNSETLSVCLKLELVGIKKIFMFPIHTATETLKKLRQHGVSDKNPMNLNTLDEINGVMRRKFCVDYMKVKKQYPKFKSVPYELSKILKQNKPIPTHLYKRYDLWSNVVFAKTLEYNFTPDQSEIQKDSSVAAPLSCWGSQYDVCAWSYHYGKTQPPPSSKTSPETRTLGHFLRADEDEVFKLMNQLSMNQYNEDNHVSVQCQKELELGARSFNKQTPEQRLIQTSLEFNVSKGIFPFVPEQGMTDSEIKTTKRTLDHIRQLDKGHSVFFSMDFIKWCLNWRKEATRRCGMMYDELFGLNGHYEQSHNYFIDCNIFCNSRMHPPDYDYFGNPIPGPFFMNDYAGGFEGMHQKKWTHITTCALVLALEKIDMKGTIMGQGDNQVLIINFGNISDEELKKQVDLVAKTINEISRDMHHELKLTETWHSRHLHEYGKFRVYKGISVSSGTQKVARCMPDINDGLFSINSSISTINTITESTARADHRAEPAFIVNQIMTLSYMHRKRIITRLDDYTKKMRLLMTPADFGGYPLSSFFSHNVRGHDDKLTVWCSILKTVQRLNKELYLRLIQYWKTSSDKPGVTAEERSRLFDDPYCLNIQTLPTTSEKIKEASLRYLTSDQVTNPMIKKLYDADVSMSMDRITEELNRLTPLYPTMQKHLRDQSNPALMLKLQNRLTHIKTIESICQNTFLTDYIKLIEETNKESVRIVTKRLGTNENNVDRHFFDNLECPTQIAHQLREKNWGDKILGVTKAPYQHQVIFRILDDCSKEQLSRCVRLAVSDEFMRCPKLSHLCFGSFKPYVGHHTSANMKRPELTLLERTSYTQALLKIGQVRAWMQNLGQKEMVALCDELIREKVPLIRVPVEMETIDDVLPGVKKGCMFHRFLTSIDSAFAVTNCLPSVSTHFEQSSNYLADKTGSGRDFSIFYQGIYIGGIKQCSVAAHYGAKPAPVYVQEMVCVGCTHEIHQPDFVFQGPAPVNLAPTHYQLPFKEVNVALPVINADMTDVMSFYTGFELARNIDENYSHFHGQTTKLNLSDSFIKGEISVNDFRCFDLRRMLDIICVSSSHVRRLAKCDLPVLRCVSSNLSFSYFADLVIQSQRIEELRQILGQEFSQHTMATTVRGLSTFIGKTIVPFIPTILPDLKKKFFYLFSRGETEQALATSYETVIEYARMYWGMDKKRYNAIKMQKRFYKFNTEKFLKVAVAEYLPFPKSQTIAHWRALDRAGMAHESVKVEKKWIPSKGCFFPFSAISIYHANRVRTDVFRTISIRSLSFLCRPLGSISSSASKFVEIIHALELVNLFRISENSILSIAEGSGGTFSTLLSMFPLMTGIYNTLIRSNIDRRDDPVNIVPPAAMNNGLIGSGRILDNTLCTGETDILSVRFCEKLVKTLSQHQFDLVTMDAESMTHSSNIEFVRTLIPLLAKGQVGMIMFKMFMREDTESDVETFFAVNDFKGYIWFFIKPMASDPFSSEMFLVLLRDDYASTRTIEIDRLRSQWSNCSVYLKSSPLMSDREFSDYYTISSIIVQQYKSVGLVEKFSIATAYSPLMKDGTICSMHCKNLLIEMLDSIDTVHTNEDKVSVFTVVRAGGTNDSLYRLICDAIYLLVHYRKERRADKKCDNLLSDINLLRLITCNQNELANYRRSPFFSSFITLDMNNGLFLEQCPNFKHFLRDYTLNPVCSCTVQKRVWTERMKEQSLSYYLIETLRRHLHILSSEDSFFDFEVVTFEELKYYEGITMGHSLKLKNRRDADGNILNDKKEIIYYQKPDDEPKYVYSIYANLGDDL
nr:TPA_asm: RNA-dependent RNA polymerase [forcipomyiae 1 virus]